MDYEEILNYIENIVEEIEFEEISILEIKEKLEIYYLPCKAKMYLKDLTEKKCITILRQFLKYIDYLLSYIYYYNLFIYLFQLLAK